MKNYTSSDMSAGIPRLTYEGQHVADILSGNYSGLCTKRSEFIAMAEGIRGCRNTYEIHGTSAYKTPPCKKWLCPRCRTRHARSDYFRLWHQFRECEQSRLYAIRLSQDVGNLRGDDVELARQNLLTAFHALADAPQWQVFERSGGTVHLTWKLADSGYGDGYYPHLHLICYAIERPNWEVLIPTIRNHLGISRHSSFDFLYQKRVHSVGAHARYVTHVRNLIPGYPRKGKDPLGFTTTGPWLLPRISDADIQAFRDATYRCHRIVLVNPDPAIEQYARLMSVAAMRSLV